MSAKAVATTGTASRIESTLDRRPDRWGTCGVGYGDLDGGDREAAPGRAPGERIPSGWIVDADGAPTDDPGAYRDGVALLPFGADQVHKGYGLSFMVEVLAGLLTGIGYAADPEGIHNDGVFVAVFDVRRFRTLEAFERDMSGFIEYLKSTPRAPGVDEILVPGEPERARPNGGDGRGSTSTSPRGSGS